MPCVGIISDTHSHWDEEIVSYFEPCTQIWHAGDFGSISVVEKLKKIALLKGVFGNIDDHSIRQMFPSHLYFNYYGLYIWIQHIGGHLKKIHPKVKKLLTQHHIDIFICGHSHILQIGRPLGLNHVLYINPGAAGLFGIQKKRTLLRLYIEPKKVNRVEIIHLL